MSAMFTDALMKRDLDELFTPLCKFKTLPLQSGVTDKLCIRDVKP